MGFFKQFSEAQWEFTYGAPNDPDNHNALQVGIVGYFYIDKGYLPEKRQAAANILMKYTEMFGEKLKVGFTNNLKQKTSFNNSTLEAILSCVINTQEESVELNLFSEFSLKHASNYRVSYFSPVDWYEMVHRTLSCLSLYLPVSEIENITQRVSLEKMLVDFCSKLKPISGLFGLGIQQCYDSDNYQHLEYDIGREFLAIDIPTTGYSKKNRNGIRTINWYTFIQDKWLDKLGGEEQLTATLNDDRIKLIPYSGGLIIRAGEWPELGWVKRNPYPELYVKVNNALKPIRAPEIGSMGYGSIAGEIRFNKRTTAEWLKRFDDAPLPPPEEKPKETQKEKFRITLWTGEPAPHAGMWATLNKRGLEYATVKKGESLPPWFDNEQQIHRTQWTLLERDDGGPVEFDAVVKE